MGGVEMGKTDESLGRRLQIMIHKREQTEASGKDKYAL